MPADGTQIVQFCIVAISDNISLIDKQRRIRLDFLCYPFFQRFTEIELLTHSLQGFILGMLTSHLDWLDSLQGMLQLHNFTRRNSTHSHFGNDTFQVTDTMQLIIHQLLELRFLEEIFHDVESFIDWTHIFQWKDKPAAEHTASHCRYGAVDDIQKRRTIVLHRSHQFETADGKAVHTHELILLNTGKCCNMIDLGMLGNLQILHDGSAGNDTVLQMFYTKTLQRFGLEMTEEFLSGSLFGENPVVQFVCTVFSSETLFEFLFHGTIIKHFFRLEVAHQFLHIVGSTFPCKEFARRDVEEAYTTRSFSEMDSSKEIVLLVVQDVIAHRHTRSHQFRNATLHHLIHLAKSLLTLDFQAFLLWIFQLVAHGNTLAGTYQLR